MLFKIKLIIDFQLFFLLYYKMIDSVAIVAIITGVSALLVSILTHIKTSSCRNGEIVVRTTESHTPVATTEEHFNYGNMIKSVSRPSSPAIMKPQDLEKPQDKVSDPIPIPKPETPLLLRKNYV